MNGISITREADTNTLLITTEAADLRRTVGPVAWCVLEHLALNATPAAASGWIVVTNVRVIAAACGIGKDRAAAALRSLKDIGLVTTAATGRAPGARFEPFRYRVHLSAPAPDPHHATSTQIESRSSRHARDLVPNPTLFGNDQ